MPTTGLFTPPPGGLFGSVSLFGTAKEAISGGLFSQSTLGPSSVGAQVQIKNPFANYKPVPVQKKADGENSSDSDGNNDGREDEKKCPSPETFKAAPDKGLRDQAKPLTPSPYTKAISVLAL